MQKAAGASRDQGERIQQYVRAKWRRPDNEEEIESTGRRLDESLRSRIDALGLDDEQLLRVPVDQVMERLEQLE